MITKEQIEILSKYYRIDEFTIMREYLQLVFLSYLYQEKASEKIYFKGGTALRLLFDSSRFSEDLDFSSSYNKKQIITMVKKLEKSIRNEIPELKILILHSGKQSIRFRIKYYSPDFKYPFVIRLDFQEADIEKPPKISPLVTKFPIVIFPLVGHLSEEEILAEKICALVTRGKGRDVFDTWFLLKKDTPIDWQLTARKLKERGEDNIDKQLVLYKIKNYPQNKLHDLDQFLPRSERKIIPILKEELVKLF